uniref:GDNF/GAS1 domain-containing protein n=1 Tax=Octopus bimaculoides TaxID=37653 RepID=A0A0L8GPX5_OCTBM
MKATISMCLLILCVAADERCMELGQKYCDKAMLTYPLATPDMNYCNRLELFLSCFTPIDSCHKRLKRISDVDCKHSTFELPLFPVQKECINLANKHCTAVMKKMPISKPDVNFCKRMILFQTCYSPTDPCTDLFRRVLDRQCLRDDPNSISASCIHISNSILIAVLVSTIC